MAENDVAEQKGRSWLPGIGAILKNRVVTGIFVILPIYITWVVVRFVFSTMQGATEPWARWLAETLAEGAPSESARALFKSYLGWIVPVLAVLLTLFVLYVLGLLAANVVGRRLLSAVDAIAHRIPGVKTIYSSTKQIMSTFSGDGFIAGQRVVLVEFPHRDMRVVAFMTSQLKDADSGKGLCCVFIPTTPNVSTGYMEIVPLDRVIQTNWTVEEAFKTVLSGGLICPPAVQFSVPAENPKLRSGEESPKLEGA